MIAALLVAAGSSLFEPAFPASREAVVVVAVENMYSAADESVDVVSQATLGQLVEVLETSGPFARVRTPDRYAGWLLNAAIREYEDPAAPRFARSAHGIDCSGLASRVYHANGVAVPRDADLQFEDPTASKVERAGLQAGDLVFFGSAPDRITHVGPYVADGRFIDATTYETPVVREDRLDDPHWSSIYQGARRPR